MLDIRFIRENADLVQEKAKQKGYDVNIKMLLDLDKKKRSLLAEKESELHAKNDQARTIAKEGGSSDPGHMRKGKEIKQKLVLIDKELDPVEAELARLIKDVPNVFPDDTPLGGEAANQEINKWGEAKTGNVQDHLAWAEERGLIDFERGAKVAGNKFYYLKNSLVELELAILQFAIQFAKQNGYWPMSVPHLVSTKALEGAGFSARGKEKQVYKVEGEDLNLIATAEIPLTGYFADEIMPSEWLPSKMVAWSPSYRVEGGAYGKYNRGLFRVHQFNKVEMYVLSRPEDSEAMHQELLEMEEKFCQQLDIPYRVVRIAAGDLGAPAYKKFDVEYWSPTDKAYRELMSCSNVTDYQARRMNIRYKNTEGKNEFVHTLNATLAATSRLMIAIIENNQTKDGKVAIPKALQAYMSGQDNI